MILGIRPIRATFSCDRHSDALIQQIVRSNLIWGIVWLVYLGAEGAVLVNSSLIDGAIFLRSDQVKMALEFVVHFWPLACTVVVLNGLRHVLSIPAELGANWIFRLTESQGRAEWMAAVERFVIAYAIAPIYLVLFPVAGILLGWPLATRVTILQVIVSLSLFEILFCSWQKLPFTCSYIPGERPLVGVVGKYMALLVVVVPFLSVMVAVGSQLGILFAIFVTVFAGLWIWLRVRRREGWGEAKLIYEDVPTVVADLGLKELTYAGIEAQQRRTAARHAGYVDTEDSDSWSDARLRGSRIHPTDFGGRAESGGRGTLSSPAPARTSGAAEFGMGRLGEQPASQILPAQRSGAQAVERGGDPLAQNVGGNRKNHGASLTGLPFAKYYEPVWIRLRVSFRRKQLDRELEEELAFHLAMREEQLRANGVHEASEAAYRQFGNLTALKETCREVWMFASFDAFWRDFRYGCRQLRLNLGFSIAAAITLSMGIAATTTMYSVCSALIWQKLPFPDGGSLVMLLEAFPGNPHFWSPSTPADVEDLRKNDSLLLNLASWENGIANIVDQGGEPVRVDQARVTASFFNVLGVPPEIGRSFLPEEDYAGRNRVVVLSDRLWRQRFHADPSLLGKPVRINERDYTVVGVMPATFAFPRASKELWTPLALTADERDSRSTPRLDSIGRLKPGHSLSEVQAELDGLAPRLEKLHPQTNAKRRFMTWTAQRYLVGDYAAQFARLLLGAALFVLLIACVNVANLQFARGTGRWKEVAVRLALGAGRSRIVVQLVTESIVLALTGAGLGVLFARFALQAIREDLPNELQRYSSGWTDLGINLGVMAFVVATAVTSGIVAGLAPAIQISRPNLIRSLKEGGNSSAGPVRLRISSFLLAAEIALTVVLLTGAGLMIHGFQTLVNGKTFIEPSSLLALHLELSTTTHRTPDQITAFYRQVQERIGALPGVQSVAAVSALPYSRHARISTFVIQGRDTQPGAQHANALWQAVSVGYFQTLHIPLRAGRLLSERDSAQAQRSAVISEETARLWWPGQQLPIGQQIRLSAKGPWITIVGVVAGVNASMMDQYPGPAVYVPQAQTPEEGMDIAIRTNVDPLSVAPLVRVAVRAVDSEQPITDLMTVEAMKRNEVIGLSYAAVLMSIFGAAGLLLACIGIYGTTAYLVGRQRHEIGIRMALGAGHWSLLRAICLRSLRPASAGVAFGLLLSFVLGRLLASVIWGVSPTDPTVLIGVPLFLDLAACLAIYIAASRSLRFDPIIALRME